MVQALLDGLVQGVSFAVIGLAFSLVYSTTQTFHVALGGIYTLAPYVLLSILESGLAWSVGVVLALLVSGAVGLLCEEVLHWPLGRKSAPPAVHLVASLGMFLALVQAVVLLWGNDTQILRTGIDRVLHFGDLRLTQGQLVICVGGIALICGFFVWLHRSTLGLLFRALADNPILLSLLGRDIRRLRRLVFVISGGLCCAASLAGAYDVGFGPQMGLRMVLAGAIAAVVGGRRSLAGAAVAGMLLGVLRSQVVWLASARWEEAVSYLFLALILFLRPNGLFGSRPRLEEAP